MPKRVIHNHLAAISAIVADLDNRLQARRYSQNTQQEMRRHKAGLLWQDLHTRTLDMRDFHGQTIFSAVKLHSPTQRERSVYLAQGRGERFFIGLFRSDRIEYPVEHWEHFEHWYGFAYIREQRFSKLICTFLTEGEYPIVYPSLNLSVNENGQLCQDIKAQLLKFNDAPQPIL